MRRSAFSLTSLLFVLAFLMLLFGFFFFARFSGSSRDRTFKVVPLEKAVDPERK